MRTDGSLPPEGAIYTDADGVLAGADKISQAADTVGASSWGRIAGGDWIGNFGSLQQFVVGCEWLDKLNRIVAGQMHEMADHLRAHVAGARDISAEHIQRAPDVPTSMT